MTEVTDSVPGQDDPKQQVRNKENNPFSEEEKHGDEAKRRAPGSHEEYQGDPSVQRRSPGVGDDPDANPEEGDERKIA
jgi:hypothetical protein